ncbi:MAG TPA: hypothetical protein VK502_00560, partial [Candidatus Saccharimonadales bacterium]|nr:hypothetical protein [Candidatus Saccharimonadales bacterium]
MSVSFGKGAVAFFNIGWKATLVVVPPKGGFENRSAKDPGFIYIDDEKTPEGVFRKLPVMERTSDTVRDIVTL